MTSMFHEHWPWRRDGQGGRVIDRVPRWFRLGLGGILVVFAGVAMAIWSVGHQPARWHADPLAAERTGKPNDYLVAPDGQGAAVPDLVFETIAEPPEALMARFHAIAMGAPRVEMIAGGPEEGHATYVQRSAIFGFPDYISVRAIGMDGGAGLAIWSRSRFGYSDLGVNRDRVQAWLSQLDDR